MDDAVGSIRRFNRFYTQRIGVLEEGLLDSPFSLTEVRVLYELDQRGEATAADLCRDLGLDAGYLSRILRRFEGSRLIERRASLSDARQSLIRLTQEGKEAFAPLNERQNRHVGSLIAGLPAIDQDRLVAAMATIESILAGQEDQPIFLRDHRPGDIGWLIERHGAIYAQERGYDSQFEALVAQIGADFLREHNPEKERCWIAERAGERLGCVMLVTASDEVAKLRVLLVEPSARGLGIGNRLVDSCIEFAREKGYKRLVLWTQSELVAAGRIYQAAGFKLKEEEPMPNFGREDLVAQTWELSLDDPRQVPSS